MGGVYISERCREQPDLSDEHAPSSGSQPAMRSYELSPHYRREALHSTSPGHALALHK